MAQNAKQTILEKLLIEGSYTVDLLTVTKTELSALRTLVDKGILCSTDSTVTFIQPNKEYTIQLNAIQVIRDNLGRLDYPLSRITVLGSF